MKNSHRTFRLFISSTFRDMQIERRLLHRRIFPRLREVCREKGATFQAIDLRWGVSDLHQRDHRTIALCLAEIRRCQRVSPNLNFLALVGERYGWEPLPERISVEDFGILLAAANSQDSRLLSHWYRLDRNAIPEEMRLLSLNNLNTPPDRWGATEASLRIALRNALEASPLGHAHAMKYFRSATHQEIVAGLSGIENLRGDNPSPFLACLRSVRGLPPQNEEFRDRDTSVVDGVKQSLRESLNPDAITEYQAAWRPVDGGIDFDHDWFVEVIGDRLVQSINKTVHGIGSRPEPVPRSGEEPKLHKSVLEDTAASVVARERDAVDVLEVVQELAGDCPVLISGPSGSGKTALSACVAARAKQGPALVVIRFCGATPRSLRVGALMRGIIMELEDRLGLQRSGSSDRSGSMAQFESLLNRATPARPILLILDGVNQLDRQAALRDWLPRPLPGDVGVLLSGTSAFRSVLPRVRELPIRSLDRGEARDMLRSLLRARGRRLTVEQEDVVLTGYDGTRLPLYLRLQLDEVQDWASWHCPEALPKTLEGLLEATVARLADEHDPVRGDSRTPVVNRVLQLLHASRYGLAEPEILEALASEGGFIAQLEASVHHPLETPSLPDALWVRLLSDLRGLLVESSAQGLDVWRLRHRQIGEIVTGRALGDDGEFWAHQCLARYFHAPPTPTWSGDEVTASEARTLAELPYHLMKSGDWQSWADCVTHPGFLVATAQTELIDVLVEDMVASTEALPKSVVMRVDPWRRTLESILHLVLRGEVHWRPHRILVQLLLELPAGNPVRTEFKSWLRMNRPNHMVLTMTSEDRVPTGGLRTLQGHTGVPRPPRISACQGKLLSCADFDDPFVRVWDLSTGACERLDHGDTDVTGFVFLDEHSICSWCADGSLHLWDLESGNRRTPRFTFEGPVRGVRRLSERQVLAWSDDEIGLWLIDQDYWVDKARVEGTPILDLVVLSSGSVITACADAQRVWSLSEGKLSLNRVRPLHGAKVTALSGRVISNLERPDGTERVVVEDDATFEVISVLDEDRQPDRWHAELFRDYGSLDFAGWGWDRRQDDWSIAYVPLDAHYVVTWRPGRIWNPRCWKVESGECVGVLPGKGVRVAGAVATPSGEAILMGPDGLLTVWDPLRGSVIRRLGRGKTSFTSCASLHDGRIVAGSEDGTLITWGSHSDEPVAEIKAHGGSICGVMELADGRVASWSTDRSIKLWNLGDIAATNTARPKSGRGVGASHTRGSIRKVLPHGTRAFAIWSGHSQIEIVDGPSGRVRRLPLGQRGVRLREVDVWADGGIVVSGFRPGGFAPFLSVWDSDGQLLRESMELHGPPSIVPLPRHGRIHPIPEFPDASLLVGCNGDRKYYAWAPRSGELIPFQDYVCRRAEHWIDQQPIVISPLGSTPEGQAHFADGSPGPLVQVLCDGNLLGRRGASVWLWNAQGSEIWKRQFRYTVVGMLAREDGTLIVWTQSESGKRLVPNVIDGQTGATVADLSVFGADAASLCVLDDGTLVGILEASGSFGQDPFSTDTVVVTDGAGCEVDRLSVAECFREHPELWAEWAAFRGKASGDIVAFASGETVYASVAGRHVCWIDEGSWQLEAVQGSGSLFLSGDEEIRVIDVASV